MYSKNTQNFLKTLFDIGAIKIDTEGGFRLALHDKNPSAPLSPIYVNLRTKDNPKPGPLLADHVVTIASEMERVAEKAGIHFDGVAGIPRAGVPFAKAFCDIRKKLQKPTRMICLKKRGVSSRAMCVDAEHVIREPSETRKRILLVDDLITKATTKWTAIDALRRGGYEAAGIVVYLDREQGGLLSLSQSGIPIVATLTFGKVLEFYRDVGLMSPKDFSIINRYLKST